MSLIKQRWPTVKLSTVATIQTGVAKGAEKVEDPVELPYIRVANVQDGYLDLSEIKRIRLNASKVSRFLLRQGDVLLTEGGDFDKLGRGAVWRGEIETCVHQNHVFVVRPDQKRLRPDFLALLTGSSYGRKYFTSCSKQSTNLASINSTQLKDFPVLLPSVQEQEAVLHFLSTWDAAIEKTERLIAVKEKRFGWLADQVLFGRQVKGKRKSTRWYSIPTGWNLAKIGDFADEVSVVNREGQDLPVLSCTKHAGLVDSLSFFGKQVFSQDTSTYKVVSEKQFVYATNHIEEGSIGYQNLYPRALVSPMYTVFEANESVDDRYLFRVLKTSVYRHIFEVNTSASVDRRGSLRWTEFSKLPFPLPPKEEQQQIADLLETASMEIATLEKLLEQIRKQKRGLMQKLLTGEWQTVRAGEMEPV